MKEEFEVRVLEVDYETCKKKLEELGSEKIGSYYQRRYVYDFHPEVKGRWIRLRTDGEKTTLAIKDIRKNQKIGDVQELEFSVSDFDKASLFLEALGYPFRAYQENRRELYKLGEVEFAFDKWPFIPMYMEIEGPNQKSVEDALQQLGITEYTLLNTESIYKEVYGIDINQYKELKEEIK